MNRKSILLFTTLKVVLVVLCLLIVIYLSTTNLNALFVGVFPISTFPTEDEVYSMPIVLRINNKCPVLITDVCATDSISGAQLLLDSYYYDHGTLLMHGTTGKLLKTEFNDHYGSYLSFAEGSWVNGNGAEEIILILEYGDIESPNWEVIIHYRILGIFPKKVQVK